ncbi:hypothetical protein ACEPAF_5987 [Sanghuangporus sanghuang]
MYHDKRFQKDRGFSLVAFNHEQIREAVFGSSLLTNHSNFKQITERILHVDTHVLSQLSIRMGSGERVIPQTLDEMLCFDLIHDLDLVGRHVQGSITNKRFMRNEIWSIVYQKDVTSLLSGTAIKAVIMYIMDYITKSSLNTSSIFDVIKAVFDRN